MLSMFCCNMDRRFSMFVPGIDLHLQFQKYTNSFLIPITSCNMKWGVSILINCCTEFCPPLTVTDQELNKNKEHEQFRSTKADIQIAGMYMHTSKISACFNSTCKVLKTGFLSEFSRSIYFMKHRKAVACLLAAAIRMGVWES